MSDDEPTIDELEAAMRVLLWLHIEEDNGLLRDHISIVRSALDSIITARESALGVVWPATSDKAGVRQVEERRLLAEEPK